MNRTIRFLIFIFLCNFYQLQAQIVGDTAKWEKTILKFESWDREKPPPAGANLFVGSSSIAIWSDIGDYFPGYKVINRGFGGSQFSDVLYYVDRVIVPYRPAVVFIYEGDNDIAAGENPKAVFREAKQLRKIIAKRLPGALVVFISTKPSIARIQFKQQCENLNARLKKYAARARRTAYADVWSAMLDTSGNVYTDIFLSDNLHMNARGYQIWKQVLTPYLVK